MPRISKATEYNWKRLNATPENRLTARANKTASQRLVVAVGYLKDAVADRLLERLGGLDAEVADIMYSLCLIALEQAGIADRPHVRSFIEARGGEFRPVGIEVEADTFTRGFDVLGFVYQSLVAEGVRNVSGIYYTPRGVAGYLVGNHAFGPESTVLDPCCGSGAFLLSVSGVAPENLYGFDVDPVAVMIASVNLLLKYPDCVFEPRIYRYDFLDKGAHADAAPEIPGQFDFIFTNPPWGADRIAAYRSFFPEIKSGERASMVVAESLRRLRRGGRACFLLPLSLLTTRAHGDIRRILLSDTRIDRIHNLDGRFDGVFTRFFAVDVSACRVDGQNYQVIDGRGDAVGVSIAQADYRRGDIPMAAPSPTGRAVIDRMEAARFTDLGGSRWALGIVTGDNKNKLFDSPRQGAEPIVTGRDVGPMGLNGPSKYVVFDPATFQQCAPEAIYRAEEKLIYRFIAKYPVVAYDDGRQLCLNSANIVVPDLETISVKSACVLLNSMLYRFYYQSRFKDIKVLKSSLASLPFPRLSAEADKRLSGLLDAYMAGACGREELDGAVFDLFGLQPDEKDYVINSFKEETK